MLKEKVDNFVHKVSDFIIDGKTTYEKTCVEINCFSLNDLRKNCILKGIVDYDKNKVSFSGSIDVSLKDIPKPWVFETLGSEYFVLDEKTIELEKIDVQLKTKVDTHIITKSNILLKKLTTN